MQATAVIDAPPDVVFGVLADPGQHPAIDGTGWVRQAHDNTPLSAPGQIFRVAMYHPNHPDGDYEMFNLVQVCEPPNVIAWEPGYDAGGGELRFGGWVWRYDLAPSGPGRTTVTLTYDWSAVPTEIREHIGFPPFPPEHLDNSLAHLAEMATA